MCVCGGGGGGGGVSFIFFRNEPHYTQTCELGLMIVEIATLLCVWYETGLNCKWIRNSHTHTHARTHARTESLELARPHTYIHARTYARTKANAKLL